MDTEYDNEVEVPKTPFLDILNRANQFAGADRAPLLKIIVGREEVAAMMTNQEIGLLGDVIEAPGQAEHPRVTVGFTPRNLIDAVNKAPSSKVKIRYDHTKPARPFLIEDGTGYEVWVVPRKEQKPEI
jgi:DNA polymerase III sliding clamp (beta) subunit (PCNA family)